LGYIEQLIGWVKRKVAYYFQFYKGTKASFISIGIWGMKCLVISCSDNWWLTGQNNGLKNTIKFVR